MCGRFLLESEVEDLVARYDTEYTIDDEFKLGEIFPSENPITIINTNEKNSIKVMKWGFPMRGTKRLVINARSETAFTKLMFKNSLAKKRCIIPANAFFEWKGDKGNKVKHKIEKTGSPIFSLAGIYNNFKNDSNIFYEAFTILTLPALGGIKDVHDRMPLILDIEEENYWLNSGSETSLIESILKKPRAMEFTILPLAN